MKANFLESSKQELPFNPIEGCLCIQRDNHIIALLLCGVDDNKQSINIGAGMPAFDGPDLVSSNYFR